MQKVSYNKGVIKSSSIRCFGPVIRDSEITSRMLSGQESSIILVLPGFPPCREGYTAVCYRSPRLFKELELSRGDGSYMKVLKNLAKTDLLVVDDWGLAALTEPERRDFLEIMEDRHGIRSTIMTSQYPVSKWFDLIGESTMADAILDRIVHNAHKINLKGESMRKKRAKLTKDEHCM